MISPKLSPVAVIFAAIVVVVGVVAVWVNRDQPAPEVEPVVDVAPVIQRIEIPPLPETPVDLAAEFELQGELPGLNESDEAVRAHLQLLGGMAPLQWLADDQLIRRIVVQVANMADGDLIYQQSPLRQPSTLVVENLGSDRYRLDPTSYQRYDAYAEFLAEIQPDLMVAFYRYYEPLLDQAYAELGNPIGAFRGEMLTAIEMILAAPVIETPIELIYMGAGLGYEFADPALEALPMVHKQLIRMGPENTRRVQATLRALRDRIS